MQITCDTPIGDLISKDDVNKALSEMAKYKERNYNYSQNLSAELSKGFSKTACVQNGLPILYSHASTIVSDINKTANDFGAARGVLLQAAEDQRKKELNELLKKIQEKIDQLKADQRAAQNKAIKSSSDPGRSTTIATGNVGGSKPYASEIEKYEKRKEEVNKEISSIANQVTISAA